jgi:ribonuclease G
MTRELLVSRFGGRVWAAVREGGSTIELRVEESGERRGAAGTLVKGRVTKVLPGMQSAFVDIGLERDAFLHVSELLLPEEAPPELDGNADLDVEDNGEETDDDDAALEVAEPQASPARTWPDPVIRRAPIQDRLKEGRELLVQVVRGAIRSKGPRASCYLALPGRFLVHLPQLRVRGVSRRISDPEERDRLREILRALAPEGGFIARTAGRGAPEASFRADATMLVEAWNGIRERAERTSAPAMVYGELDLLRRMLRDAPREGYDRIVVDTADSYERAMDYLRDLDPAMAAGVELHTGTEPLFQELGLDQDIERALHPRVRLKSGGSVVIEQTEALVSIDVNTGKFVGRSELEETVLRTNLEAAAEIARQLRIRDLGGIIVIDFIDMTRPDSRKEVLSALESALKRDRARTKIIGLSELGLVQLTRKRTRPGLAGFLTHDCPLCGGHGRLKRPEVVAAEAMQEVRRLVPSLEERVVTIRAHPDVGSVLRATTHVETPGADDGRPATIRVEDDATLRPDLFEIAAR